MGTLGTKNHESIGADYLVKQGFKTSMTELIKNHVKAKRYLVTTNINYYTNLSDASKKTFDIQGGFMSSNEVHEFENSSSFKDSLLVRECDEEAKVKNMKIPPLEYFTDYCNKCLH